MDIPEFGIDEVSRRALSIGTGFSMRVNFMGTQDEDQSISTAPMSDADGRAVTLDEEGYQAVRWVTQSKHWIAWVNRKRGQFVNFDAPSPLEIRRIMLAEWEAEQIASESGAGVEKPSRTRL